MPPERKPVEGIFITPTLRAMESLIESLTDPLRESQRQMIDAMFLKTYFGTGAPRRPPAAMEARAETEAPMPPVQPALSPIEKPQQVPRRKRGPKRKLIPGSPKMTVRAEQEIEQLINEGKDDREIADELGFPWTHPDDPNQRHLKKIRRVRESLEPPSA